MRCPMLTFLSPTLTGDVPVAGENDTIISWWQLGTRIRWIGLGREYIIFIDIGFHAEVLEDVCCTISYNVHRKIEMSIQSVRWMSIFYHDVQQQLPYRYQPTNTYLFQSERRYYTQYRDEEGVYLLLNSLLICILVRWLYTFSRFDFYEDVDCRIWLNQITKVAMCVCYSGCLRTFCS